MPEYDPARRGAADSSFVAGDVDTLAGMGAAGGGAHAEGEMSSSTAWSARPTHGDLHDQAVARAALEPRFAVTR